MNANPAAEMLESQLGHDVAGGCDRCNAVQRLHREAEGIFRLAISHHDDCPELAFHTRIAPLEARLADLRRQWCQWRDTRPEDLAARDDLDLSEIVPEARGDRVLAARAWRAGIMATIRELGHGLNEQLAAELERVGGS